MIKGIDVSDWEPNIDWQKVKNAGYRFAFIKASQSDYPDPKFHEHWRNARLAGMPRGAFHFYDTVSTPNKQAETFYALVKDDYGELPFIIDIEKYTSGAYFGSQYWYDFIEHLNQLSNNHPLMIYTGYYYWIENAWRKPSVQGMNYFAKYPLYISRYKATEPLIPSPWNSYLFWQYSEEELIDGVMDELGRKTECDVDLFNGTEEEFQSLLVTTNYSGETPNMPILYTTQLKSGAASNLRQSPTQSSSILQVLTGPLTVNLISEKTVAEGYDWYQTDLGGYIAITSSYSIPVPYTPPTTGSHTVEVIVDGVSVYKTTLS